MVLEVGEWSLWHLKFQNVLLNNLYLIHLSHVHIFKIRSINTVIDIIQYHFFLFKGMICWAGFFLFDTEDNYNAKYLDICSYRLGYFCVPKCFYEGLLLGDANESKPVEYFVRHCLDPPLPTMMWNGQYGWSWLIWLGHG